MKRAVRIPLKIVLWITGIIAALLLTVQLILSPKVLTPIVLKVADYFLDADVSFSKVGIKVFGALPDISITIDSCVVTYPSERFCRFTTKENSLKSSRIGCAVGWASAPEEVRDFTPENKCDTLAQIGSLRATVNPFALLKEWKLNVRRIDIDAIRLYAHRYDSTSVNWNILKNISASDKEDDDTTAGKGMPVPEIGKIVIKGKQFLLYSDEVKHSAEMFYLDYMEINGNLESGNDITEDFHIHADTVAVLHASRTDTLLLRLDKLDLSSARNGGLDASIASTYSFATEKEGRSQIPINLDLNIDLVEDTVWHFNIINLKGNLGSIGLALNGDVAFPQDSLYLNASLDIEHSPIGDFLDKYHELLPDEMAAMRTDATLDIHLKTEGFLVYAPLKLPSFTASVRIPESNVWWGEEKLARLGFDVESDNLRKGRINVLLKKLSLNADNGSYIRVSGRGNDILGKDPHVKASAQVNALLKPWSDALGSDTTFRFSGHLLTQLDADFKLSQLNLEHFTESDISCTLNADDLKFYMPGTVDAAADGLSIHLGAVANTQYEGIEKGARVIEETISLDTAYAKLPEGLTFEIGHLTNAGHENAAMLNDTALNAFFAYYLDLNLGSAAISDKGGSRLDVSHFNNFIKVTPDETRDAVPVFDISSKIQKAALLGNDFTISADSLAVEMESVKHDNSTVVSSRSEAKERRESVDMADVLQYIYREWDTEGYARIKRAGIRHNILPLRPHIESFDFRFSNDALDLKNFNAFLGSNDFHIDGNISNIKNAILNEDILKAELNVRSHRLDLNELFATLSLQEERYRELYPDDTTYATEERPVPEAAASADTTVGMPYFEVPDKFNARLSIKGEKILYSDITVDSLATEVEMRDKCIRISEINASSNLGDLDFTGFYSTRSKDEIYAGINFGLSKVTAAEVISLIPSIDTLLPVLQTFNGVLSCRIAGATQLDTNLNFLLPTTAGILRISGDSLHLEQSDALAKATKMLMFKDNTEMNVQRMSVETYVRDGMLEVFPFMLSVDRYKLALAGQQNIDQSFKYHISVIKSPLPFRLGLNIYGPDFDNLKFKLVKPLFKSEESIPVYTSAIDETCLNLSNIISNIYQTSIEEAMNDETLLRAIEQKKKFLSGESTEEEFTPEELSGFEEEARKVNNQ